MSDEKRIGISCGDTEETKDLSISTMPCNQVIEIGSAGRIDVLDACESVQVTQYDVVNGLVYFNHPVAGDCVMSATLFVLFYTQ